VVIRRGHAARLARAPGWLIVSACLLAACATATIPPIGTGAVPFTPAADERALWLRAEREHAVLVEHAWVHRDPPLEDYLDRLAERLLPADVKAAGAPAPRIVVLADPTLNAFALPDGHVYLHTGLLSRLESEGQLAALLARELAHYTRRHALRRVRAAGGAPALDVIGDVARVGAAAAADAAGPREGGVAVMSRAAMAILGQGLQLAALAAIQGHGPRLERAADREGMRWLAAAGWDRDEMHRVFAVLAEEAAGRGRIELFRLGRVAALRERIASVRAWLDAGPPGAHAATGGVTTGDEFDARLLRVVRENAWLDVRAGRFALARRQLDRVLAASPDDPVAHVYYGDLHRLGAQRPRPAEERAADMQRAREHYERAAVLDPAYAEPFRELGLLYYQANEPVKARAAFERNLALKPDAPDGRRIREYVVELTR
jgi:predicted Zn-dependent protease